jgi:hypothetical protein
MHVSTLLGLEHGWDARNGLQQDSAFAALPTSGQGTIGRVQKQKAGFENYFRAASPVIP